MPSYEDRRRYQVERRALVRAVDDSLYEMDASSIWWSEDRCEATASIGISFLSWGEKIHVLLGNSGRVTIRSKCAFPLQLIDWGKNASNVNDLFRRIENWLDDYEGR